MSNEEKWVAVAPQADLAEGAMMGIDLGEKQIVICNVEGQVYALDNICTHAYALLSDGFLDGDILECPLHGGAFCVKDGAGQGAPISEDVKTYPVRVVNDTIEVNVG